MIVADGRLRLLRGPKENCARPAIDPLFRSVAESHGPGAIGVILTGNLNDGTLGLFEIARRGGVTIAQESDDAAHPGMPRSAAANVALDYTSRLADMPKLLIELVNEKDAKEKEKKAMPIAPSQTGVERSPGMIDGRSFERPVAITCPDCGGALHRSEIGPVTKFNCHIGHSYTAQTMALAQFDKIAAVLGFNVTKYKVAEFCISAIFSGLAGAMLIFYMGAASVDTVIDISIGVQIIIAAILGGRRTIIGAAFGAVFLLMATEFLRPLGQLNTFVVAAVALAVILLFPEGMLGFALRAGRRE